MTPIVFMVYNRPDKTKEVLDAFLQCDEITDCIIYAFSDGPRNQTATEKVEEVRRILHNYKNRLNIQIIERQENYGCSKNVVSAVSEVLKKSEYIIYVEDDILPNKDFIIYMKNMLERYKNDDNVFSINSYNQLKKPIGEGTYYSDRFSSWGSGFFRRSWKNVEFKFKKNNQLIGYDKDYLKEITNTKVKYVAPDLYLTFLEHKKGYTVWNHNGDMWDVQCLYYMLANDLVAVTPFIDYSKNVGITDNSGIHERKTGIKKLITEFARYAMVYTHTTGFFQKIYHDLKSN